MVRNQQIEQLGDLATLFQQNSFEAMKKYLPGIVALICCLLGCARHSEKHAAEKNFESFEMSYSNGWTINLSFLVDSNKIYFSPKESDTSVYGILPDSIFLLIDSVCSEMVHNNIISKNSGCLDCPVMAVRVITKKDTIQAKQTGDIDHIFLALIKNMQDFLHSGKHSLINSNLLLQTQRSVSYPVPPIVDSSSKPAGKTK